jgi:hypothetical protein
VRRLICSANFLSKVPHCLQSARPVSTFPIQETRKLREPASPTEGDREAPSALGAHRAGVQHRFNFRALCTVKPAISSFVVFSRSLQRGWK